MADPVVQAILDNWELGAGAAGGIGITAFALKTLLKRIFEKYDAIEARMAEHAEKHASRDELNKSIGSLRKEFSEKTQEVKKEISDTRVEIKHDLNNISSNIHHQLNQALEIVKIFKGKD